MSPAEQTTPITKRLIIHHLSDLHYTPPTGDDDSDILVKYSGYLAKLPKDRKPDLVVVTGDLTASGTKVDLEKVAQGLSICFPWWRDDMHKHVVVVPGPHDVNWEDHASPGLKTFYESFKRFALPTLDGVPAGRATSGPEPVLVGETDRAAFVAYPLDTCYSPDDLKPALRKEFTEYANRYREFVNQRKKLAKRERGLWGRLAALRKRRSENPHTEAVTQLRDKYLDLTEGAPPVALDSGRITQKDVRQFELWADALKLKQAQPDAPKDPLRILVTHHALAVESEQDETPGASQDVIRQYQRVAKAARGAGFHLALHGHIHKPQVLSDLSILEGADPRHPMRQIGAASFGETLLFNEITAQYRAEAKAEAKPEANAGAEPGATAEAKTKAKAEANAEANAEAKQDGIWRLELRLVHVDETDDTKSSALVLLNPAESADTEVERLKREADVREKFDRRMRIAMRGFSEQVYRLLNENRADKANSDLLSEAMRPFEGMIRDVIFDGFHTRVRLILKNIDPYTSAISLSEQYLTFADTKDTDPLLYPASIAAWSLVLGRTLYHPNYPKIDTTEEDHDWMRRSDKIPDLLAALEALMRASASRSSPSLDADKRLEKLYDLLKAVKDNRGAKITEHDMYQEPLGSALLPGFPNFICVPYPMRPRNGSPSALPEIAVLEVGVRVMNRPDGSQPQAGTELEEPVKPFTPERIAMLECVMELIGLTLTTTNALDKPKGVWDKRPRVNR